MAGNSRPRHAASTRSRRSILDLAPLELECMRCLWEMGEGTVREIYDAMKRRRPRAYTTVLTIMDRLTRKGAVERVKARRAWVYRPCISAADARARAVWQVVEHFFEGSPDALKSHLSAPLTAPAEMPRPAPRAAGDAPATLVTRAEPPQRVSHAPHRRRADSSRSRVASGGSSAMDDSLL
jgi:predicted transcriptional regulator